MTRLAGDMAWDGLEQSKYNVDLWNKALGTYARKHGLVAIPPMHASRVCVLKPLVAGAIGHPPFSVLLVKVRSKHGSRGSGWQWQRLQ